MATLPAWKADGTGTTAAGAVNINWPGSHAAGDFALLIVNSSNQSIATPSGWTPVTGSGVGTGTAATADSCALYVFYKFATSGAEPAVNIADSGDHQMGVIVTFTGVSTVTPIETTATSTKASNSTSETLPGITTAGANRLVVAIVSTGQESTKSSWTFGGLGSFTARASMTGTSGLDGGVACATGSMATAGSTGTGSCTSSIASKAAYLTLALTPVDHEGAGSGAAALTLEGAASADQPATAGSTALAMAPAATLTGTAVCSGTAALTLRADTPWTPAHASGLQGWYVADDLRNTHIGGEFRTLYDLSGNDRTATAVAGSSTLRTPAALGGRAAAVTTNDTIDGFIVSGAQGIYRNKAAGTLASVYDIDASAGTSITYLIFNATGTGATTRFSLVAANGSTLNAPGLRSKRLDGTSTAALSSATAHTGPTLLVGQVDWANDDAWVYTDGTLEASTTNQHGSAGNTSDTNANYDLRLLRTYPTDDSATFDGAAGEWVLYDTLLSGADRERLEGYLAHAWGLTGNLPGGHPYKTVMPLAGGAALLAGVTAAAPLALTPAATLTAAGALAGTLTATVTPSATQSAAGALTGASAIGVDGSATLAGNGALSGATALGVAAAATATLPSGELQGSTALSVAPSAGLAGAAALTGTTAASLTVSATLTGGGALVGAAALILSPSAALSGAGALVGAAAGVFSPAVTAGAHGALVGSTTVSVAPSAQLAATGTLAGASPLATTATATATATGALVGATTASLTASAATAGAGPLAGAVTFATVATATATASGTLLGAAALGVAPAADAQGLADVQGATALACTASATGNLLGALDGAALIATALVAELLGRAAATGTAPLIWLAAAQAVGTELPAVDVERPDSWLDGEVPRFGGDTPSIPRSEAESLAAPRPGVTLATAERP